MSDMSLVFTEFEFFPGCVVHLNNVAGSTKTGWYRVVSTLPNRHARIACMETGEIRVVEYFVVELGSAKAH